METKFEGTTVVPLALEIYPIEPSPCRELVIEALFVADTLDA